MKTTNLESHGPFIPIRADVLFQAMLALRGQAQLEYEKAETDEILSIKDTEAWRHAKTIEAALIAARDGESEHPRRYLSKREESAPLIKSNGSIDPFDFGLVSTPTEENTRFQSEDADAYLFVCSSPPGTSICYASLDPFGREYLSRTGRTENPWHKVTRQDLVTRGEPKVVYQAKPDDIQS